MPGKQVLKCHSPQLGRPVLWEAGAPSSRAARSEGGWGVWVILRSTSPVVILSPRQPEQLKDKAFLHRQHWGRPHSQVFPPQPEARQRGQRIRAARPAAIYTLGSVLSLLGPGVPAAHAAWLWKQKAHARVSAGVQLRMAGEEWGDSTCRLRGAHWKCSLSAPPRPC